MITSFYLVIILQTTYISPLLFTILLAFFIVFFLFFMNHSLFICSARARER